MGLDADIEMRWVNAWNDLSDIVGNRRDVPCQLPDWSVIDAGQCRDWIQDSAYKGYFVRVEAGWVGHRLGVIVLRWREAASEFTATHDRIAPIRPLR